MDDSAQCMPLISVCVPTYNGMPYVEDAVRSVLAQTYSNLEIIVSDDQSTDGTVACVRDILLKAGVRHVIDVHERLGIGGNWNRCVARAKGQYIKYLMQDDLLDPDCIARMVKVAMLGDDVGLVFCRRKMITDEPGRYQEWWSTFGELHHDWKHLQALNSGRVLLRQCSRLLREPRCKVGEPTAVLLHREVFNRVGYFDESLKQILDFDYWYRVFKDFNVGFVDAALVTIRLHDRQATHDNTRNGIADYRRYYKVMRNNLFDCVAPNVQVRLLWETIVVPFWKRLLGGIKRRLLRE